MPITGEEAHYKGLIDLLTNNTLSSVKIIHGAKKVTWEVKVYHKDPDQAMEIADNINLNLMERYK